MNPDQVRGMSNAAQLLQTGRLAEAEAALDQLAVELKDEPRWWWSRAALLQVKGDLAGAEAAFRRTAELDPGSPMIPNALGELLADQGRLEEAHDVWQAAYALEPTYPPSTGNLADYLLRKGDARAALAVVERGISSPADPSLLHLRAAIRSELGDAQGAIADHRAVVMATKGEPQAVLSLASALYMNGAVEEGLTQIQRLLALQPGVPDAWRILAQGYQLLDRLEDAERALDRALQVDPMNPGVHRDRSQLIWSRTGDRDAALERIDAALATQPDLVSLLVIKGKLLEYVGDLAAARDLLVPAAQKDAAPNYLLCAASQVLVSSDPAQALTLAERAIVRAPRDSFGLAVLAEAQLAVGDAAAAEATASKIREMAPRDQHGLALLATAWRLQGDARWNALYDYDAFLKTLVIETPEGWPTLEAYLEELSWVLIALHSSKAHPIGQSLRGGTQTSQALEQSSHPALKAFFAAVDKPIRDYIAALGEGDDPMRSRRREGYRLSGSWSVRLQPGGGRHVDHLHNNGWISSAFYVSLPASVLADDGQGALRFGQPGTPTQPALEAERHVAPRPGMLALFPSYMWHGVEPFGGEEPRLTIAFDVVPA